ncbi:MAG: hypothetical protein M1821_006159 [Bathelium mastoideum]|nr:MAG: hypothetical protein M1821_006159 [Bathelium mastoideum]KAI9686497.1 MAG: hypothetical protein M1822_003508 [Bathelium mastoideum]
MLAQWNRRLTLVVLFPTVFIILTLLSLRTGIHKQIIQHLDLPPERRPHVDIDGISLEAPKKDGTTNPRHPIYKPESKPIEPIVDNFPLAQAATSYADMPPIPLWNRPPAPHFYESTPLVIGFTRNWKLLQQVIASYITSGWPSEDIYVIENTGTFKANENGKLSLQNPFYLDWRRLTGIFSVNVISTPTLLTYSQLQNFILGVAMDKGWEHYFSSHMDVVALSEEELSLNDDAGYKSLYERCVDDLTRTMQPDYAVDPATGRQGRWGMKAYGDGRGLVLVNARALQEIGGWDAQIPYAGARCDVQERLAMKGFQLTDAFVGGVFDVGDSLENVGSLYRRRQISTKDEEGESVQIEVEDERAGEGYKKLKEQLLKMQQAKQADGGRLRYKWRNTQGGGREEPWYRDPEGFEKAMVMTNEFSQKLMAEKWGHAGCGLREAGLSINDAWRVEHDW